MSILAKILERKQHGSPRKSQSEHKSFFDFLQEAAVEIDGLIRENSNWYSELPYRAPMGREEARELEIEKRAIWRRVIYDAKRSKLAALKWDSSRDDKVCEHCGQHEGKVFFLNEYEELNKIVMHVGCRCNLMPVRDPDAEKS